MRRRVVSRYSIAGWEPGRLPSVAVVATEWSGTQFHFDTRSWVGWVAHRYYQPRVPDDAYWAKSVHYEAGRLATYDLIRDVRRMGVPEMVVNAGVYTLLIAERLSEFCSDGTGEGN
jgi:hypothetical protein